MVDLALAAKLLRALGPRTRLILLGDPGQLASVEAGAVLASLCAGAHGFSPASARLIAEVTGCQPRSDPDASSLADCVAILDRSHRFDATGAIAALAAGVRGGDAVGVAAIVARGGAALRRVPDVAAAVVDAMHDGFGPFVELVRAGGDAATLLQAADRFRALAGTRSGPLGSVQLNAAFERRLRRIVGANDRAEWYPGRLVIVTANDYALRLFNGDIGVALPEATRGSALRVHFPAARAGEPPRSLATVRMPPCESAFALTVHKSQGSEFDEVLVVMPGPESPLATRELLYTAVTRAVSRVMLAASDEAIRVAVTRTQARRSGLADALWARPG